MGRAFIAYAREDEDFMSKLRSALEAEGVDVWTDQDISRTDDDWKRTVERNIGSACCVIVLFSPTAKNSRFVNGEHELARASEKPVFRVFVRGKKAVDAIPFDWLGANFIDVRGLKAGEWNEREVGLLVADVKKLC